MTGSRRAAIVVLAIVALLNLGYAVYRQLNGADIGSSLPLLIGFLVCAGLAGLFWLQGRMRGPR